MGKKWILNPRIWLLALGMTALVIGIVHGDVSRVMIKGATVCLECIGLG